MAEEDAIVQYISQLDARGFSLQKADVEDMANLLLLKRDARRATHRKVLDRSFHCATTRAL
jgi:hypothetical protein